MKKHLKATFYFSLSAAVLLLTVAGCSKSDKEPEKEVSVQAAPAQKTDISRVVASEAVIFPIAQSIITPKISAPVRKFYVVRGQKVRQGQLLATLENRDLEAARIDNQGSYEQAQAAYTTSVGATLPEDIQKAESDFQNAQKALDAEQKLYTSREQLFKEGALPRKDMDQAAVSLTQAKNQYALAKRHLDSLNAIGKQQALKSASGQLTSAKGKFMGAEAQFSYSEIRSPISGVITDRPLYPGEMASTSAPLITVMDISKVIAKAHIPQSDALLLKKGDKATLEVPGLDKVDATVTVVSPALDPNSTTVEVWVQAANPKQQLRPGTTAQISMIAQTAHDALVVPTPALLELSGDQAKVMVVGSDSTAQSRDVKIGIHDQQQAQILSGVKEGEQVITQGNYGLEDKTKVKVEKQAAESQAGNDKDKDKDKDKD